MFGNSSRAPGNGGISKAVSALGTAVGLGVAVMSAPLVFFKTKTWLYDYFIFYAKDADITLTLVWLMNAIFFFVIFGVVSMLLSFILIWILARFAAKTLG